MNQIVIVFIIGGTTDKIPFLSGSNDGLCIFLFVITSNHLNDNNSNNTRKANNEMK